MRAGTGWLTAGAAAVVIAATTALVLTRAGDDPPPCGLAPVPSANGPTTDGTGISVLELGFSALPDSIPRLSIGAILQNTTDRTAYRTQVVFSATDASGAVVVNPPESNYAMIEVPVIPPRGKVAVGNLVQGDLDAKAAAVTVTPSVTAWLPAGDATNGLAPITGTAVAGTGAWTADGGGEVWFTAQGSNCTELLSRGVGIACPATTPATG